VSHWGLDVGGLGAEDLMVDLEEGSMVDLEEGSTVDLEEGSTVDLEEGSTVDLDEEGSAVDCGLSVDWSSSAASHSRRAMCSADFGGVVPNHL